MTNRLPDDYFTAMYAHAADPWQLSERWYERRKYAITLAMLPSPGYRHAFEPGCSVGVLTAHLVDRCERVTATDVAERALSATADRLDRLGRRERVSLRRSSIDEPWPAETFDLVVLSEVAYYLSADTLRTVLDRECGRLADGTTLVASHWRHPVDDYPLTGDQANEIIEETAGLVTSARYRDDDVTITVLGKGAMRSVATATNLPGAQATSRGSASDDYGRDGPPT